MKKQIAMLTLAALAAFATPAWAQDKIVVGAYAANPPWEFKNDAGVFEGQAHRP